MNENFRKKKIVFLLNDMDIGGVQKSMIAMLKYLASLQQFEIDVIIWQKGGLLEKEIPPAINIIHQSYPPTLNDIKIEKRLLKRVENLYQLFRFKWFTIFKEKPWYYYNIVQKQYDIAVSYVHRGYPLCFTIDKVNASRKILWFHHGIYEATEKQKLLDDIFFNLYDTIVAVSDSNKDHITSNFPKLNKKLEVIPNLIEVEEIKQRSEDCIIDLPKSPNVYNIVTVSRISQEKGIDLALDVAYKLKDRGLKFKWYFIGDGETFAEMTQYIIEKEISDVCVLLGSRVNPYPHMRLADFYVQPSYVESQCMTVYEALALKKLIVATNLHALQDALQHGKLGILCNPDADEFANAIEQLISDDAFKRDLKRTLEKYIVSNRVTYQKINDLFKI